MTLWVFTVLSRCLNALPPPVIRAMAYGFGWFWFHVLRFRRDIVLDNLRLAFGAERSEAEIRRLALGNFRNYSFNVLEVIQSLTWTRDDLRKAIPYEGVEHLANALAEGKGAYVLTFHISNWELFAGSIASQGYPGDVVVKRAKNEKVDRFLTSNRERMGIGIIIETGTAGAILTALARGHFVIFPNDQFMGPPIGLPVNLFGRPAGTAVGPALLSERRNAPFVVSYIYRNAEGRLRGVVEPIQLPPLPEDREERLYKKTQFFNDALEKVVRRHPDQWLWLHRRWKEYRGEPRWKLRPALTSAFAALLLLIAVGCASQSDVETPTGIALPPDPEVSVLDDKPVIEEPVVETVPKQPAAIEEKPKEPPKEKAKPRVRKGLSLRSYKPEQLPFEIGEQQTLALDWTAIHAGTVRMEVREGFPFQGRPTFRFWGTVLSSRVVDALYHVDNTIESFVDKQWMVPYKFLLHMVETHQMKETRAAFDHKKNKVHYWSKRISKKWGDETQNREDALTPLSQDMFSALYYARMLDYQQGKLIEVPVYENRQNLVVGLTPVANEFVRTRAGAFQCWKIAVTIKLNNVLRPNGDLFLWLSDDSKKYIVKFDTKLKLGSLRGELIKIRERL